jgi:hypothetical protein
MNRLNLLAAVLLAGTPLTAQDATRPPGWVVLPVNEYQALHSKAYPVERAADLPPVDATLTRVDYDLRLNGPVASGLATLTVDVLKDGWVRIPIPPGLLVREAKLGGKPVSLVATPDHPGQLSAVLPQKGRSVLLLDVVFAVTSIGAEESLRLPGSSSGVTRVSIASPPQDVEMKLVGGLVSEKSASRWLAYAGGGPGGDNALVFTWRKKIEEHRAELPLRMRGSLTQLYALGEDSTSLNAEVEIEVLQGAAHQVKIAVPPNVTINQVPGAGVADWDVKPGQLVVNFLEPVERSAKFLITGETVLARDGSIDVPLLRLLETERETGGVAIDVLGAGEILNTKPQGLDATDAAELGDLVARRQSPSLAAFRLRAGAPSYSLNVQVARYAQQAVLTANVEEARYRVLITGEGKTLVEARYAVRNNQRNFVRISAPAGAVVWSSALAGRPVRPGKAPDGSLLFPLTKGRAGEEAPLAAIEILYLVRGAEWTVKGRATLALPVLDLPVSRTGLLLYYSPLFHVTPEPGAFSLQPFERPESPVLLAATASAPASEAPQNTNAVNSATQALVDRYRARSDARKTAAPLPVRVAFPAVGPSLYLVSELTGESKPPVVDLNYQKEKKGGVK